MSETHSFCALVAAVVISVLGCITYISANDNAAVTAMVQAGADPQAARCAVDGSRGGPCAVLAAKH